ncbi:MAG: sel1 repeat family protein [Bacteroidaceae bacterium]|nr:sel1 repeat family protein [Bacteroidaceae bacterium]
MTTSVIIETENSFCCNKFLDYADIPEFELNRVVKDEGINAWFFSRKNISTTLFLLQETAGGYELHVDNIAAYDDLKFFPYLADTLTKFLNGYIANAAVDSLYKIFDEEWVVDTISEEVAQLKGILSIAPQYFPSLPARTYNYVSVGTLRKFGVNLNSSTPRIYGYIQYAMRNNLLPCGEPLVPTDMEDIDNIIEVDIPQHMPIGRVKSWQLDGCETYETYSQEDVNLLLTLAKEHRKGKAVHGVVLNDIGTLFHEGVGIPMNGEEAIYWFKEALKAGDTLYAPTNLGDLYRKGCGSVKPSLQKAFEAYKESTDPYAHYRIGQAYEEGWTEAPNIKEAEKWYKRAAKEGHHLAIKRLKKE